MKGGGGGGGGKNCQNIDYVISHFLRNLDRGLQVTPTNVVLSLNHTSFLSSDVSVWDIVLKERFLSALYKNPFW